jgi:AAHS family 4-hydroxybenzoate transporter-like MFS transporter
MNQIDVTEVIDQSPLAPLQLIVLLLCTVCLIIDGFDVQALGYVAPAIMRDWHVAKAGFGPVFGAGLLGMTLGALCLGVVADKVGRRPVLIGSLLFLAACSYATTHCNSLNELLVLRFLTGLGMGAIIPNAIALAGEYSPSRIRVSLMMVTSSGFIIGGVVGGALASVIIPAYGWQSVFLIGAVAPLLLALCMLVALPESVQFMVLRERPAAQIFYSLARIAPHLPLSAGSTFLVREARGKGVPVAQLFRKQMATGTLLLWIVNFMNLICAYFLANWLPVMMSEAGHSPSQAVLAGTTLWIGGLLGNLILGWLVDRHGFGPVMTAMFCVGTVSIAAVGQVSGELPQALLVITIVGFCVMGGQSALNALAATYYPTSVRTTGIGWAMGIGRFGSILGPLIGGELMRLNWPVNQLFLAAAVPTSIAVVASLLFWWKVPLRPAVQDTPHEDAISGSAKTAH